MRFVCGELFTENQWVEKAGGEGGRGRRKKSFVCMHSRNCIMDIIMINIILNSCRGGDVSKSPPSDGDFFWLALV